jgi:hypothetical protein
MRRPPIDLSRPIDLAGAARARLWNISAWRGRLRRGPVMQINARTPAYASHPLPTPG